MCTTTTNSILNAIIVLDNYLIIMLLIKSQKSRVGTYCVIKPLINDYLCVIKSIFLFKFIDHLRYYVAATYSLRLAVRRLDEHNYVEGRPPHRDKDRGALSAGPVVQFTGTRGDLLTFFTYLTVRTRHYDLLHVEITPYSTDGRYGRDEERMVQRTHGPVAGQEFFHGSGTGSAQGTVQVPGDIGLENVSQMTILCII